MTSKTSTSLCRSSTLLFWIWTYAYLGIAGIAGEARLPGSTLDLEKAIGRSQIIAVAQVVGLGSVHPGPPGVIRYSGVKLMPLSILKGRPMVGELTLEALLVQGLPKETAEIAPTKGGVYLVFIERPSKFQLWGIKLLSPTKANLDALTEFQRKEERLPGSEFSILECRETSDAIVAGMLLEMAKLPSNSNSLTDYTAKIRVSRRFIGTTGLTQTTTLRVVTSPNEASEKSPTVGTNYVFFLNSHANNLVHCRKVVQATDQSLQTVSEAMDYPQAPVD